MYQVSRPRMYLVIIAVLVLQCTVSRFLAIGGVRPDLVILPVIFFGLFFGSSRGFEAGLVAGFFEDLLTLDVFAMTMFVYAAVGLASGLVRRQFSKESPLSRAIIVWGLTALAMILHFALTAFFCPYYAVPFTEYVGGILVPVATMTALFSLIVLPQLVSWFAMRDTEEYL